MNAGDCSAACVNVLNNLGGKLRALEFRGEGLLLYQTEVSRTRNQYTPLGFWIPVFEDLTF